MSLEAKRLLELLAGHIAEAADLEHEGAPRELWIFEAIETDAADVYSVLRCYDGTVAYVPTRGASIQVTTIGKANDDAGAWEQAQAIVASLCDAGGRPLRHLELAGAAGEQAIRVLGFRELRGPGQIRRDTRGRVELVTNFDAEYVPLPPAPAPEP